MPIACIENRICLDVIGEDSFAFLQGIITNDLSHLEKNPALYACLLTPQGKFLHDFILTAIDGGYRLEVLQEELPDLVKRLKMYKLRSKVQLKPQENMFIYGMWSEQNIPSMAYPDPRLPAMGYRMLSKEHIDTTATFLDYDKHRIQNGIPDGGRDLRPQLSSLYEANIDLLKGVSFDKGCYLGQELTARIHYRGLVKKRLFLVISDNAVFEIGQDILDENERPVGQVFSVSGQIALACIKVSAIQQPLMSPSGHSVTLKKLGWLTI